MPSTFSWLDYSEHERRRALDVISAFHVRETRDELGLGSIRDTIADTLTPGTTTLHTRARYFLFVPWIYLAAERKSVASDRIDRWVRHEEERLIGALIGSDDPRGTIGGEAGATVKRMPSNVYWAALRSWRVLLFEGSQAQYHRSLDRFHDSVRRQRAREREQGGSSTRPVNWHPHVPEPPDEFPEVASFRMRQQDSEYLRERILAVAPGTLLAHLVDRAEPWNTDEVAFAWEHPGLGSFPEDVQEDIGHARTFSELMHGASLLYNLMLAEAIEREEWVERYRERLAEWAAMIAARRTVIDAWERDAFWAWLGVHGGRIPLPTRRFVDRWTQAVQESGDAAELFEDDTLREMIEEREAFLKRGRARLQSRRHLELWGGSAGAGQLEFRWQITQDLLRDIIEGFSVPPEREGPLSASIRGA